MSMQTQPHFSNEIDFDLNWIERIFLKIADAFKIQIVWDRNAAILTGTLAVAGGLLGGFAAGRSVAVLGAGIGGATGLGISTVVSLREVWATVKEKLKELLYIVLNFLRRLDSTDYERAFKILMACSNSKKELAHMIVEVMVNKLGPKVLSSITA